MSDHTYTFNISMSCGGCSGAVERVLKKLEGMTPPPPSHTPHRPAAQRGTALCLASAFPPPPEQSNTDRVPTPGVKTFDVNLESQTAKITTEPNLSYETVLATIKKTGKAVNSGEADGQAQAV